MTVTAQVRAQLKPLFEQYDDYLHGLQEDEEEEEFEDEGLEGGSEEAGGAVVGLPGGEQGAGAFEVAGRGASMAGSLTAGVAPRLRSSKLKYAPTMSKDQRAAILSNLSKVPSRRIPSAGVTGARSMSGDGDIDEDRPSGQVVASSSGSMVAQGAKSVTGASSAPRAKSRSGLRYAPTMTKDQRAAILKSVTTTSAGRGKEADGEGDAEIVGKRSKSVSTAIHAAAAVRPASHAHAYGHADLPKPSPRDRRRSSIDEEPQQHRQSREELRRSLEMALAERGGGGKAGFHMPGIPHRSNKVAPEPTEAAGGGKEAFSEHPREAEAVHVAIVKAHGAAAGSTLIGASTVSQGLDAALDHIRVSQQHASLPAQQVAGDQDAWGPPSPSGPSMVSRPEEPAKRGR